MFVFSEVSLILGYFMTNYSINKSDLKSKVYGLPILSISFIYTFMQLLLSIIIFAANKFTVTPAWLSAVISIILLALALIGVIAADNAKDIIEKSDMKITEKLQNVKEFKLNIDSLCNSCTDKDIIKQLEKLSEKIKYSDPVSSDKLYDIEQKISKEIEEISNMIFNNNYVGLSDKIDSIDRLVDDRNKKCKEYK